MMKYKNVIKGITGFYTLLAVISIYYVFHTYRYAYFIASTNEARTMYFTALGSFAIIHFLSVVIVIMLLKILTNKN